MKNIRRKSKTLKRPHFDFTNFRRSFPNLKVVTVINYLAGMEI